MNNKAQASHRVPPTTLSLAQDFAELARTLYGQPTEDAAWQAIVQAASEAIPGVEDADITIMRGHQFRTVAPTSDLPRRVDEIQYELRSGPCVDAILEETIFCTGNLADDQRWPEFGKRAAAEHGVHSMLAFRLFVEGDDTIGGLNLYSTRQDAFDDTAIIVGGVFATHAAIALSGARTLSQAENLRRAQESNREIGVAIGILMSRHRITQQQAFDLLRMASQHTHRKLREIAVDVTETGMLDFPPGTGSGIGSVAAGVS
ncbi:MAG: GAF and ANTAR domain-containing protein [Jatrophihabitans sp.]